MSITLDYFVEIPGPIENPGSDLVKASADLKKLIGFKPGDRVFRQPGIEFNGETHDSFGSRSTFKYVNKQNFQALQELLNSYNVRFETDRIQPLTLCCPETTELSKKLLFYNWTDQAVLCVSPDVPVTARPIRTFLKERGEVEEKIEFEYVKNWIEHVARGVADGSLMDDFEAPDFNMRIFPKRSNARGYYGRVLRVFSDGTTVTGRGPMPTNFLFKTMHFEWVATCPRCYGDKNSKKREEFLYRIKQNSVKAEMDNKYSVLKVGRRFGHFVDFGNVGVKFGKVKVFFNPEENE